MFLAPSDFLEYAEQYLSPFPTVSTLFRALYHDINEQPGEAYQSLDAYEAWLAAPPDGFVCAARAYAEDESPVLFIYPEVRGHDELSKAEFLIRLNEEKPAPHLFGAVLAAARQLYREGRLADARDALQRQIARHSHHLLDQALAVLELALAGRPVPLYLEDVFGQSDYFKKRFCPLPFSELAVEPSGRLFACHSQFLDLSVGALDAGGIEASVNSEMAVKIRESILDGSFRYCNRLKCSHITSGRLPSRRGIAREARWRAVLDSGQAIVAEWERVIWRVPLMLVSGPDGPPEFFLDALDLDSHIPAVAERHPITADLLRGLHKEILGAPGNINDALQYYIRWIEAEDDPLVCTLVPLSGAAESMLCMHPAGGTGEQISKAEFLVRLNRLFRRNPDMARPHLTGAAFVAARSLYRQGDLAEAREVLTEEIKQEDHALLQMGLVVVDYALSGLSLPRHLQDVFGESDYFKDRFCPIPFSELQIEPDGKVFSCCSLYLNLQVGDIRKSAAAEVLNSDLAKGIRGSILEGNFRYCNRLTCSFIAGDNLPTRAEAREHPRYKEYIDNNTTELTRLDRVVMALDRTCNLSCPCCRQDLIIEKGEEFSWRTKFVKDSLLPMLKNVAELSLDGAGEFIMSEACRTIIETVNPADFPGLKLDFITNGLLLNEAFWRRYQNIAGMVQTVRVSIDAATAPTYAKLRRRGDFARLQHNLGILANMRRSGEIARLGMYFIYQVDNLQEMKSFVQWAQQLGADEVVFEALHDRESYPPGVYQTLAVHHLAHPQYAEFRETVADPIFAHPMVVRDWIAEGAELYDSHHMAFLPLAVLGLEDGRTLTFGSPSDMDRHAKALADRFTALAAFLSALAMEIRRKPTGSYDAVVPFDAWLSAADDRAAYTVQPRLNGGNVFCVDLRGENDSPDTNISKAEWLIALNAEKTHTYLHGGLFAAARNLYRAGRFAEAHAALAAQAAREQHFINMAALRVAELGLAGEQVPPHLAGIFGDSDHLRGRVCPKPFSELAAESGGNLFVCHSHWLNLPVGEQGSAGIEAALNSEIAVKIRESVLDGSFRYCNRVHCPHIFNDTLPTMEEAHADLSLGRLLDRRATEIERIDRLVMLLPFTLVPGEGESPAAFFDPQSLDVMAERLAATLPATAALLRALRHDVGLRPTDADPSWIENYDAWLYAEDDPLICTLRTVSGVAPPMLFLAPRGDAGAAAMSKADFLLRLNEQRSPQPDVGLYHPYLVGAVCAAVKALVREGRVGDARAALATQSARAPDPLLAAAARSLDLGGAGASILGDAGPAVAQASAEMPAPAE